MKQKLRSAASVGQQQHKNPEWGRLAEIPWGTTLLMLSILLFCPYMVVYFWMACDSYQCSLWKPIELLLNGGTVKSVLVATLPQPTTEAFVLYAGWLVFQAVLYAILPSKISNGQTTPAGHLLQYKTNGMLAWTLTVGAFTGLSSIGLGLFPASIIFDNWGGLLVAANVYGYSLALFCYVKAFLFPSHPNDRKFTNSKIYDFHMGIELNPRFGELWDFKLFHNGRPGIIGWTLIDISCAAAQYQSHGFVSNSMLLVMFLHAMYVVDFFYHEDWYLRTIDIAHDHFGFYLAWGDSVWLPWMYTLQAVYLAHHPVQLHYFTAWGILALGLAGYYIFRSVNNQKDVVRLTDGDCLIWGRRPKLIRAKYKSSDGAEHSSILLASGWWGLSRHFNYTGDLIISLSMCLPCGTGHLLPYFYFVYMFILLEQRIRRDDVRCSGKYGKYWDQYKAAVPYKLIPYVF